MGDHAGPETNVERAHRVNAVVRPESYCSLAMNQNRIIVDRWSNPDSKMLYESQWAANPQLREQYEDGFQCGGCSFYAAFNTDWGLCCHKESRHHLETVFEHFTCESICPECWGPHSFSADSDHHCRCEGQDSTWWEQMRTIIEDVRKGDRPSTET